MKSSQNRPTSEDLSANVKRRPNCGTILPSAGLKFVVHVCLHCVHYNCNHINKHSLMTYDFIVASDFEAN